MLHLPNQNLLNFLRPESFLEKVVVLVVKEMMQVQFLLQFLQENCCHRTHPHSVELFWAQLLPLSCQTHHIEISAHYCQIDLFAPHCLEISILHYLIELSAPHYLTEISVLDCLPCAFHLLHCLLHYCYH